jgi:hypothetical protein
LAGDFYFRGVEGIIAGGKPGYALLEQEGRALAEELEMKIG